MNDEKTLKEFAKWGQEPPKHFPHGTEQEIQENMKSVNPKNWRMEGNKLIADTDLGPLVQFVSTDYMLTGTDQEGNPVFAKVKL